MPRRSHAPVTAGSTGSALSSIATPRPESWASSLQTVPTPPRVGSRSHRVAGRGGEQVGDEPAERRCVGTDVGLEGEVAAGEHHRHAVIGDGSRHEHDVTGSHPLGTELASDRDDTDAGGRDEEAVGGSATDHLRVPRDDRDSRRGRGFGHVRRDDARSSLTGKPSSMTNAAESHRGTAPMHREVVDRAVNREVADRRRRGSEAASRRTSRC